MKTDRLFVTWVTAVLLMGLLLVAGSPAGGVTVTLQLRQGNSVSLRKWGKTETGAKAGLPTASGGKVTYKFGEDHKVNLAEVVETGTGALLAKAIAKQVQQVHERFTTSRKALRILNEPGNAPDYLSNEVTGLIIDTHKDLDQAIRNVQPSGTEPLRAWVDDQFQQIQGQVPPSGPTASLPRSYAPQAGAMLASLRMGGFPLVAKAEPKKPAPLKPKPDPPQATQAPKPQTIPITTADQFLDRVEKVVSKVFSLADHNDLEVNLWVGSPQVRRAKPIFWQASHVTFSFWPQGKIKDSQPPHTIIRLNGKKDHVLRGLYVYRAAWTEGGVTYLIEYPQSAGSQVIPGEGLDPVSGSRFYVIEDSQPGSQMTPSERLDLVNGTGFFCCRFDGSGYCQHVDDEKECR
ncbi:MAG TPA: hypothetical protein VGP73_09450 [Thermoanaerobaculia bacterium]